MAERMSAARMAAMCKDGLRELHLDTRRPASLYAPIDYALADGGKRLRPQLVLMAAEAFGGNATEAVEPAVGLEVFHNFTLLHDDVMDNSAVRRGRPAVHAKWDENTAILSGDAMLTLATQLVSRVRDGILRGVLADFNAMAMEVYEGQALDMEFETRAGVDVAEYMKMIGKKTGALLGAAARIGSCIGGASEQQADCMYAFGMELGLAFQICDDYLDVYGDAATFGKPIGGDILNNKKTFIFLTALASACGAEVERVAAMPATPAKVEAMTELYTRCGAAQACQRAIEAHSDKAAEALHGAGLSAECEAPFLALLSKLIVRRQ